MAQTFWAVDFWASDFWADDFWAGSGTPWRYDGPTDLALDDDATLLLFDDLSTECALDDATTLLTLDSVLIVKTLDTFVLSGVLGAQDPSTLPSWIGATGVINVKSLDTGVVVVSAAALSSLDVVTKRWSYTDSGLDISAGNYLVEVVITFTDGTTLIRRFPNYASAQLQVIEAVGPNA